MRQKLVDTRRQTAWGWAPRISLQDGIARCYDYFLDKVASS
jgi:GDP-L-fucose synthase